MYMVDGPNGWSLLVSHGIPRGEEAASMSCRLYVKRASWADLADCDDKSLMGREQSSLNSSWRPLQISDPVNQMRLPPRFMPSLAMMSLCHWFRAALYWGR